MAARSRKIQVPATSSYEDAVWKLGTSLQSNVDVLAKAEALGKDFKPNHVENTKTFIVRSGLSLDDVNKLSVIHISGTKGKGSTCAYCESICRSHGYKTGLFTSPHMDEVRERIRINGRPLSKEKFTSNFWKVYRNLKATEEDATGELGDAKGMPPYFAFTVILSLHVFMSEGVDVAIYEVGLGGEYDNTNFFSKPAVCGVASLGLDHCSVLGYTIGEIAWQKAGIFKKGCPAITTIQETPVYDTAPEPEGKSPMEVLLERAKERQCALYIAQPLSKEVLKKYNFTLGIAGCKQVLNAALAVQLVRMWKQRRQENDNTIVYDNAEAIPSVDMIPTLETTDLDEQTVEGLRSCFWPGRAQAIRRDKITYYLDGAHTQDSIQVCSSWFKETADQEAASLGCKISRVLVYNITGKRDPKPLLQQLLDCGFDAAVFCPNLISTLESGNKADHFNKLMTDQVQRDIPLENKAVWDTLVTEHVTPDHVRLTEGRTTPPSHTFPCILQALAWATQDKDPLVKVKDPTAVIPEVPFHLCEAEHIQVLITGSLLLVGCSLGVLTPDMNEEN